MLICLIVYAPFLAGLVAFLRRCQAGSGGFGGGPGQMPHLAPTYAAVLALVTLGGQDALSAVDRPILAGFLRSMCRPPEQGGGLSVCQGWTGDCALARLNHICWRFWC